MTTYLLRRLLLIIPTLLGVTIVAFVIMQMAPGDPLLGGGDAQGGDKSAPRRSVSYSETLTRPRQADLAEPPRVPRFRSPDADRGRRPGPIRG